MNHASTVVTRQVGQGVPDSRLWTPVARAAARLALVADEEPGSMQHFTTALLVGDLLARLHTVFVLSVLARFEDPVAQRLSFSLIRTSGAGESVSALRECWDRLQVIDLREALFQVVRWPAHTPKSTEERSGFSEVAGPLADLASRLQHGQRLQVNKRTPRLELFNLLVQVRNKTVHGAYDSRFYADHVAVVDSAVSWLIASTRLWDVDLLYVAAPGRGRLLRGQAPTRSRAIDPSHLRDEVVFSIDGESWRAAPLISIGGHDTFLANGSWRDADTSAEFLCHSLAASEPGQGTIRLTLPALQRPPLPTVGQIVDGHYEIIRVLGEGEDAVVYLACHTEERAEYVLKAFREPREAFDQRQVEFRALQQIQHPSVPRVLEIHSWEDPFHLRFDHVPGVPLGTRRGEFTGDLTAIASIAVAVSGALDAVHAAGFVHRDVAPDNILIPDNRDDPIRLVDFDLVAPIGTVGLAGTSLYRPPESEQQLPWTEAADVYSLAVVLYELLTGQLPYETKVGEVDRTPVGPPADVADRFDLILRVLVKAAALQPKQRYPSANKFLRAFRSALRATPSQTTIT